jgi:xanthosine utilization system XapX-like protein
MAISPFNARPASPEGERRRARLAIAIAMVGILAILLAYAVSPGVRHTVSHAAHSVKHAVGHVFDPDHHAASHAKPHVHLVQPLHPAQPLHSAHSK